MNLADVSIVVAALGGAVVVAAVQPNSGEFFVWYEHGREAWPPACSGGGTGFRF